MGLNKICGIVSLSQLWYYNTDWNREHTKLIVCYWDYVYIFDPKNISTLRLKSSKSKPSKPQKKKKTKKKKKKRNKISGFNQVHLFLTRKGRQFKSYNGYRDPKWKLYF